MSEQIQLLALGRPVKVGDLYNYFNDAILPMMENISKNEIQEDENSIPLGLEYHFYRHQQSEEYKRIFFGLNSHLWKSIEKGYIDINKLWFGKFFQNQTEVIENENHMAQVSILIQYISRTETIDKDMYNIVADRSLQTASTTVMTHLVEKVNFGFEILLTMRQRIDFPNETLQSIEEKLYLAAKSYLQQKLDTRRLLKLPIKIPNILQTTSCKFYSSSSKSGNPIICSFEEAERHLAKLTVSTDYQPVKITLRHVPLINILFQVEEGEDWTMTKQIQIAMMKEIERKAQTLSECLSLDRIQPLQMVLLQFRQLMPPLWHEIDKFYNSNTLEDQHNEIIKGEVKKITDLLIQIDEWVVFLQREIEMICALLQETSFTLVHYQDILQNDSADNKAHALAFILKITHRKDELIENVKRLVGDSHSSPRRPELALIMNNEDQFKLIRRKLVEFDNEARQLPYNPNFKNYIGLTESVEGSEECEVIKIINNSSKDLIESLSDDEMNGNDVAEFMNTPSLPMDQMALQLTGKEDDNKESASYQPQIREQTGKTKIGEIFAKENGQIISQGQPNIYLLNAEEILISEEFRWLKIRSKNHAESSSLSQNHKVIILMGATGSGKSTLINGMINYILAVNWIDPFRFKIVREDESTSSLSQAFSQTSSVTAYTLYHHNGMAVPYSITIIDTPGYGDTRGVKRDKEITSTIHKFLSNSGVIDKIHAACFVAASGDSRLTATQRYIIDSVLSIFGKNFKENLRLLVTFADNLDPPVLEACKAANFPVPSNSDGIIYSKFNSSVLYTSNQRPSEIDDEVSFDELFWDMGQENFSKFFTMLDRMDGQNLSSTREVIEHRKRSERMLKEIEVDIEFCIIKIEEAEILTSKLKQYRQDVANIHHFVIEKSSMENTKLPCKPGYLVYNCLHCERTCDSNQVKIAHNLKTNNISCDRVLCCCSESEHHYENFELRPKLFKTQRTFQDLQKEFEIKNNRKCTMEDLLVNTEDELGVAKAKAISLLHQLDENVRSLNAKALRSTATGPNDYLSMMTTKAMEEQKPGYMNRIEILNELQTIYTKNQTVLDNPDIHPSKPGSGGYGDFEDRSTVSTKCKETEGAVVNTRFAPFGQDITKLHGNGNPSQDVAGNKSQETHDHFYDDAANHVDQKATNSTGSKWGLPPLNKLVRATKNLFK